MNERQEKSLERFKLGSLRSDFAVLCSNRPRSTSTSRSASLTHGSSSLPIAERIAEESRNQQEFDAARAADQDGSIKIAVAQRKNPMQMTKCPRLRHQNLTERAGAPHRDAHQMRFLKYRLCKMIETALSTQLIAPRTPQIVFYAADGH